MEYANGSLMTPNFFHANVKIYDKIDHWRSLLVATADKTFIPEGLNAQCLDFMHGFGLHFAKRSMLFWLSPKIELD